MITTTSRDLGEDNLQKAIVVGELMEAYDYEQEARTHARKGQRGIIVDYSNGHGLCYQVRHTDGTTAWYEPEELSP